MSNNTEMRVSVAGPDKLNQLKVGDTIILESVPPHSYLATGVLYHVERVDSRSVCFTRRIGERTYSGVGELKSALAQFASFYHATS